ncbi:MAG: hypothetical protein CSA26_12020, partial [Desulfobacterales bacterium]
MISHLAMFLINSDQRQKPMNIVIETSGNEKEWDVFVNNHPDATPYHLSSWIKAVKEAYGFDYYRLIAKKNDTILGVLPLVHMRLPLKSTSLISVPYGDTAGILSNDKSTTKALLTAAYDLAQDKGNCDIELRGNMQYLPEEFTELFRKLPTNKVRMLLKLPENSEILWDGFKSKLRSQIRKAQKNGLSFELANHRIDDFYSVISQNMRDLGSPVHSRKWFCEIIQQYGANASLAIVSHEQRPVGAAITLQTGNKVSIPWASTLRKYNKLSPNMLLYWGILKNAAENGCSTFDFGRSTQGEGTYKFKKQWGAVEHPLEWYRLSSKNTGTQKKSRK